MQRFLCRDRALRAAWAWCSRAGFAAGGIPSRRGGRLVGGRARLALGVVGEPGLMCRLPAAFPCPQSVPRPRPSPYPRPPP